MGDQLSYSFTLKTTSKFAGLFSTSLFKMHAKEQRLSVLSVFGKFSMRLDMRIKPRSIVCKNDALFVVVYYLNLFFLRYYCIFQSLRYNFVLFIYTLQTGLKGPESF